MYCSSTTTTLTPMGQKEMSFISDTEVSSFQSLQEWYLGWEKVSCLDTYVCRCPHFRGVLIERSHCNLFCSVKGSQQVRHTPSPLHHSPTPPLHLSPSLRAHPTLTHPHPHTHLHTETTGTTQCQAPHRYFGPKIKSMCVC